MRVSLFMVVQLWRGLPPTLYINTMLDWVFNIQSDCSFLNCLRSLSYRRLSFVDEALPPFRFLLFSGCWKCGDYIGTSSRQELLNKMVFWFSKFSLEKLKLTVRTLVIVETIMYNMDNGKSRNLIDKSFMPQSILKASDTCVIVIFMPQIVRSDMIAFQFDLF